MTLHVRVALERSAARGDAALALAAPRRRIRPDADAWPADAEVGWVAGARQARNVTV